MAKVSDLRIRSADDADLEILADLNRQLIEDERHDRSAGLSVEQLRTRMAEFIHSDYRAYLFERDSAVIGYALVNHKSEPLYLRQFFICRQERRKGYGRRTFEQLLRVLDAPALDIEVLAWNESGREFWRALGFRERSIGMRYGGNQAGSKGK